MSSTKAESQHYSGRFALAASKGPKAKRTNSVNSFRPRKIEDFEIVDADNQVVGHIRVKPSGVCWKPKGGHDWFGIPLSKFADLAREHGTKQEK